MRRLRLDDLRDERREEEAGRACRRGFDRELADRLREFRDREVAELEGKLLLDQRPTREDRPGTAEAEIDDEMLARLGLPKPHDFGRYELPAHFWVAATAGIIGWSGLGADGARRDG